MPFSVTKTYVLAAMVTQQSTMTGHFKHCRSTLRVWEVKSKSTRCYHSVTK